MRSLRTRVADYLSPLAGRLESRIEDEFVSRSVGRAPDTPDFRRDLVRRFRTIHHRVTCAHQPLEMFMLAEAILRLEIPGPIVELGCFKGGSSCKLSLAARATNRQFYICDSFEGLPDPSPQDVHHDHVSGRVSDYAKGDYRGTFEEVQANIRTWGAPDACTFVKGYFSETLAGLDVQPALIFMDVDLIDSARSCIQALYPRLQKGGRFYTHEAGVETFVRGLLDPDWWHTQFQRCPPILMGAGFGLGPEGEHLGYFTK